MIDMFQQHSHSFSHMKIPARSKHDSLNNLSFPRDSSFKESSKHDQQKEVQETYTKGTKLKKIIPIRGQIKKEGGPESNIYHLFGSGQE